MRDFVVLASTALVFPGVKASSSFVAGIVAFVSTSVVIFSEVEV
jgi:hypothetical protein